MTAPLTSPPVALGKGLHTSFIKRRVPGWIQRVTPDDLKTLRKGVLAGLDSNDLQAPWFTQANEAQRQALLDCVANSVASSHALASSLKGLKGLNEFAEPLLKHALRKRFGSEVDVNNNHLYHLRGQERKVVQPLLQAALLNFESGTDFDQETLQATSAIAPAGALVSEKDGPEQYSWIINRTWQPYKYRYSETLGIKPAEFADLCRDLDLGQQYQEHLDHVFDGANQAQVRRQMIDARKDLLAVHAHRARLKSHLSAEAFEVVQALLRGETARYNGHGVWYSELEMFGSALGEVFIIGCRARLFRLPLKSWKFNVTEFLLPVRPSELLDRPLSADEQKIIVYIPGAGRHELVEYASLGDFEKALAVGLYATRMQQGFAAFVKHDEQQAFFRRLKAQRYGKRWDPKGFYEVIDNPEPDLSLKETLLTGDLFEALHERHQVRMRDNARLLAVPTAIVDNEAMWARLKHYAEIGLDVLNVAAFFVPVLGHVMLAVTAVQLSLEVYHGIEAWSVGDREEAWAHFESVALNVAAAAALIGVGAAAHTVPKIQVSRWVDGMVPVKLPNGQARLWKPDLAPYRSAVTLDPTLRPNALGQYQSGGRTYVRLGEDLYEKTFDPELKQWRINHPTDPEAYQPVLDHNHAGAWRHAHEQPLAWDRLTLMRRIGHQVEGFSDDTLLEIAEASGVDDDALRKMHIDRQSPPPLLAETLRQFRVDQQVDGMIEHLRNGTCVEGLCEYALPLIVEMPGWPREEVLEVFEGAEPWGRSQVHGTPPLGGARRTIKVTRTEAMSGKLAATVLSELDEEQIVELLGVEGAHDVSKRGQVFRDRLANHARSRKKVLFDGLYAGSHEPLEPDVLRLQRHFPSLSRYAARDLLAQASAQELAQLRSHGRIALRIAQQARVYVQQGALNRALAGLHLENMASAASDRLALHCLEHQPGWPANLRLEVRADSIHGALLDSVGSEQASVRRVLVKEGAGYQAFDPDGRVFNAKPRLGRNLYESLAAVLPESMAPAPSEHPVHGLRRQLGRYAAGHRDEMAQLLKLRPINTGRGPGLRLASGRLGYLASGRGKGFADALLINRARITYPNLSDEQAGEWIQQHLRSGKTDQQVAHLLNNRQRELDGLAAVLSPWADADPAPLAYGVPSRRMIAERIVAGWRDGFNRELESVVELDVRDVGRLPSWDADFSHVRALVLNSEQLLGPAGDDLLGRFPNVKRLSIRVQEAHLPALSQQLGELSTITELSLDTADVVDTQALAQALQTMPQLELLSLQDWRASLDVRPLLQLRSLTVRGSMSSWPDGVLDLPQLTTLDLRGTSINTVPAPLFSGYQTLWRGLDLDWTRLEPSTLVQVYEYLGSHVPHQLGEERMLEAYCRARLHALAPADPAFANAALERFKATGLSGRALLDHVLDLHREQVLFDQQLDEWQARVVRVDRRQVDAYVRQRAADKIRQCRADGLRAQYAPQELVAGPSWRTFAIDDVLDLADGPLGDLPALPDTTFGHVRVLNLGGARLSADSLDGFLGKFPNLRQLTLNGNRLGELPPAFDALGQLEQLHLCGNELSVTPSLQQRLNRMRSLRVLNLSYNRLGTLNVQAMEALQVLDLSHSGIRAWPTGASELPDLRRLDLSHSALTHVPEGVFSGPEQLLMGLHLQGCRLDAPTMTRVQRFAARTTQPTPVGIARERLLVGRTGGDPEFFPPQVTDDPNLLLPLTPTGSNARLTPAAQLQRLDPDLSVEEAVRRIDDLSAEGLGALDIETRLNQWQQQHEALTRGLNDWIDVRSYREGDDWISAVSRRRAADRILACWRESLRPAARTRRTMLDISELTVGELPELPRVFDHVTRLDVSGVRLSAEGSNEFFRSFTHLEHLTINGNGLSALPESLSECPQLTRLEANHNDFRDSAQLRRQLNGFTRLERLDLSDNTLGEFDVRGLDQLRVLDLSGNILSDWPEGVLEQPGLTTLNLSNNQISTIPADALLPAHGRLMGDTDLSDNLLDEVDLQRLRDYLEDTGRGLGFTLGDIDRLMEGYAISELDSGSDLDDDSDGQAHPGDETPARNKDRWLAGVADDAQDHEVWDSLAAHEDSKDLFKILSQLRHTKDFKVDPANLRRRVWEVLHAVYDDEALRDELFSLARDLRVRETCGDGRILLFNDVELKVYEFNALKNIAPEHQGRELLKLSRGLFRLDKVEGVARAASRRNPSLDPAEIRLAYRIGLEQRLALPPQPKTMIYANLARVSAQDLDAAYAAVIAEEGQPEFVEQLLARPYWMPYLEERYAAEFLQLQQRYEVRGEALEEQYPDFDEAHFAAWEQMDSERKAERLVLATELSTREIAELEGQA
ncbi:Leucine rich repeat-containing protein [Pseudomonas sp. ok272]|uniref:NEL-type E3 ubiquitin ligase domain-containing protein n=1 Tax=unclassified Pseudomonas TaxID=196821 RepID=UPI0008C0C04C|nr:MULTISPECIES: NEL-type E3 ubiquitin ligase domain-containing protein [unclassified Pseudomonas]SEM48715.1 Leucine rich repeat-containing protein [Pseudomonas sp. ok272]SFM20282.1 Leucine rich repeat-containing protein [Pseudomonas sp. ok602]